LAVQNAERDARWAAEQLELAEAAVESARAAVASARLQGEMVAQAALDVLQVANVDANLASDSADRLAADLKFARHKLGVQVPVDEIVFIPAPPVRAGYH
jgi:formiminotetrahydrofolate cyclodeaminase